MQKLRQWICENYAEDTEEQEIILYGIDLMVSAMFNLLSTVLIGMMLGRLWEGIFFLVLFVPLRSFAGGFHAKTSVRCYFYSIAMLILLLCSISFLCSLAWELLLFFVLVASFLIWWFSPVETSNRPLDEMEQQVFRKKTHCILLIECVVFAMFLYCPNHTGAVLVMESILCTAFLVVLGKLQNKNQ